MLSSNAATQSNAILHQDEDIREAATSSKTPTVAIVVPAYNRADVIKETIDSILAQTFTDFEAVFVDDGSTDDTVSIIEQYQAKDSRIRLVRNKKNLGAPRSRNKGLALTTARYVNFVDSDDVLHPEKLAKQVVLLDEGYDLVVSQALRFSSHVGEPDMVLWTNLDSPVTFSRFTTGQTNWCLNAPLWRREFLEQIGGFTEHLPWFQDWELHARALIAEPRVAIISDPLVYCRCSWSPGQITASGIAAMESERYQTYLIFAQFARKYPHQYQRIRSDLSWRLIHAGIELLRNKRFRPAGKSISAALRAAPNIVTRMRMIRVVIMSVRPKLGIKKYLFSSTTNTTS